jgi:Tol biopolymer transport system component
MARLKYRNGDGTSALFDPFDDPFPPFPPEALLNLPPTLPPQAADQAQPHLPPEIPPTEAQLHLPPTLPSPPTEAQLQLPAVQSQAAADASSLAAQLTPAFPGMADFTLVGDPTLDDTLVGENGEGRFELVSKIAFTSSRDHFDSSIPLLNQGEIYLMDSDGSDLQRLTSNEYMDALPMLSSDGKKIVFDSNRLTTDLLTNPQTGEPILNISDLFVMDADGENETLLTRGSSATWSPDSKYIAFHASASYYTSGGTVTLSPAGDAPGAATRDSDIFVANVDDLAAAPDVLTRTQLATNITNTPGLREEDADWSPDGRSIVFTSRTPGDPAGSEIYVINPDGSGRHALTHNDYEERGPSWSPDGTRIAFSARIDGPDFEICVMNADGSGIQQLTYNDVGDLTPSWSPDGTQIAFHRFISPNEAEIFVMNADGSGIQQLTDTPGTNLLAQWGEVRTRVGSDTPDGPDETFFAGSQADYSIQNLPGGSLLFADYLLA